MELIDTHAHLEDVENLEEAVKKAVKVGVIAIIAVGSDHSSNLWVIRESRKYEIRGLRIHPALGLHPLDLLNTAMVEETIDFIQKNVKSAVALGEVGLDYWYKNVRRDEEKKRFQKEVFRRMLDIARENDKPVLIHSRGAWMDCLNMTIEANIKKAVFHWFSGPNDALKKLLEHGYYISATPAAAYSKEHRGAILNTPLENIILETDSPVVYSGETSEPAHVVKALKSVAELKGENITVVAEKTTENAKKIFKIS
jgi:TatD DNase family protein